MIKLGCALMWLAVSAGTAWAQAILDIGAVPYLNAATRGYYAAFLDGNLPRAAAIAPGGQMGGSVAAKSIEAARATALQVCAEAGGQGCRLFAENLDVVWPGRETHTLPPPGPLQSSINYAFVPDARYFWRGPAAAAGVYVWAHGRNGNDVDARGLQPQPHVRAFNNAGFDIVRFDRAPMVDEVNRAAGWLEDELPALRRAGYRRIVVGGQSRGGWNSLQMLDTAGLADVVIAVSPAAHGQGASVNLSAQDDDLRRIVDGAPRSAARVAVVQFANDPFQGDADTRVGLLQRLRPRVGALLLIDRPAGFSGHGGADSRAFAQQFAACLLHFALDPAPPAACPSGPP